MQENKTFSIKEFYLQHKVLSKCVLVALACVIVLCIVVSILTSAKTQNKKDVEFYIYPETTYEQLCDSLEIKHIVDTKSMSFKTYSKALKLKKNVRPGYYIIDDEMSVLGLVRRLRNGEQQPVKLTILYARNIEDFAQRTCKDLLLEPEQLIQAIDSLGYPYPTLVYCDILPDTYEFYWTVSAKDLLAKLKATADKWWKKREKDVDKSGFTREELVTLASIVNEETNYDKEKKRIAGVYVNRLQIGQALQADPTVKFAIGDFSIRRITGQMLKTDSPFNTYTRVGLPPAPICLPNMASLKAAVNYEKHKYFYFCAKEDFSGSHNFAKTFEEHQKNAKKYHKALDKRNIK